MKVRISKFGMLIGLMKTMDEFEDWHSGRPLRALKTLTSKKLVNTITLLRNTVTISICGMLIGLINTYDEPSGNYLRV